MSIAGLNSKAETMATLMMLHSREWEMWCKVVNYIIFSDVALSQATRLASNIGVERKIIWICSSYRWPTDV